MGGWSYRGSGGRELLAFGVGDTCAKTRERLQQILLTFHTHTHIHTYTHTSVFHPIPTPTSSLQRKSSWQESLRRKVKASNRDAIFLNHRLPLSRNFQPLPGNSERLFEGYLKQKGRLAELGSHKSVEIRSFIPTQMHLNVHFHGLLKSRNKNTEEFLCRNHGSAVSSPKLHMGMCLIF